MSRSAVIARLASELYDEREASGACKTDAERAHDKAYRKGHNDRTRALILWLSEAK